MTDRILRARWNGSTLEPVGNWSTAWMHDHLSEGETVSVEIDRDRSGKSHRHQFAEIREMWQTLPECLHDAPYARSADALRKHALIATGHCDVATIDAGSKAAAERVATVLKADGEKAHGYCLVQVRGPVVVRYTPHSQSYRAMGGETFKRSKDDCLRWIGDMLEAGRNEEAA